MLSRLFSRKTAFAVLLIVVTCAVYWQVVGNDFIAYDDDAYIYENPFIRTGGSLASITWAFGTFHAANWHPVTWLSHILDVRLFGMAPAGHHAMSVLFHAANAVLLFLLFNRITGAYWRSAVVAALFALHPLHVESVAWAAERKDLLCTLFYLLCLYLYAGYAGQRRASRYALAVGSCGLALMSKPMAVTLPLVMLLLDFWPLQRIAGNGDRNAKESGKLSPAGLVREKIPFLLLAAISCGVTFIAQERGNAVTTFANTPLLTRIENGMLAYVIYLGKMIWPRNLAVFYPFPTSIPLWQALAAGVLLVAITILAIRQRRQRPYLIVGWLWFCCTLLPVIGIVRVGLQSLADRYSYIPLTGIFLALVWWLADISRDRPWRRLLLGSLTALVLTACALLTWRQTGYWRNTQTLFSHALATTHNNYLAHSMLARQLEQEGRFDEALAHLDTAINLAPWYEYAKIQQGLILKDQGRLDAAALKYTEAILQNNTSVSGHINLGIVLALQERLEEARHHFEIALKLDPLSALAHYNMGLTLSKLGRIDEAIQQYEAAKSIDPFNAECRNNLGVALVNRGRIAEAIEEFTSALQLKADFFDAYSNRELAIKLRQNRPTPP